MIELEPWVLGRPGRGYVLEGDEGIEAVIHCSDVDLNPIKQLLAIQSERGISQEELREATICGIDVDPNGSFVLTGRLEPAMQVDVAEYLVQADSGLRFKGIEPPEAAGPAAGSVPKQPSKGRMGLLGLIGAICIMASGPWSALALIYLFSRGEQRGSNETPVAICRLVGLLAVTLAILAAAAVVVGGLAAI